jgi:thiol-disulfide isomerase/thioredoxin
MPPSPMSPLSLLILGALLPWLLTQAFAASTASPTTDYLYRSMLPPEGSLPVRDYHHPQRNSDKIPSFLTSALSDYPRIVEFYSPLCPHCQQFAPKYVQFAKHFLNLTEQEGSHYASLNNIQFHAISCTGNQKVCQHENVRSYPTIKIFPAKSIEPIEIKDFELHPFKLAKILGIVAIDDGYAEIEKQMKLQQSKTKKQSKHKRYRRDKTGKLAPEKPSLPLPEHPILINPDNKTSSTDGESLLKRTQQEIFSDAYLSFYITMKNSVFLQTGMLPRDRQEVLKRFLQLLQDTLPPWRIHSLLEKLLKDFQRIVFHENVWERTLESHPPASTEWSPACRQHENGYTCGLWSLFHILTVGVTEHNVNVVDQEELQSFIATESVADTLKDFIEMFFQCEACTSHFVNGYEQCEFDRCKRLSSQPGGTLQEWKELPLWLLETHNAVNIRLQREQFERQDKPQPTEKEQQSVIWPPVNECPGCWTATAGGESQYNDAMMYAFLRLTYW